MFYFTFARGLGYAGSSSRHRDLLLPRLLLIGMLGYHLSQALNESYVDRHKPDEERKWTHSCRNITYRLPPKRMTGGETMRDGTYLFYGYPISFTEKDGVLTVNGREAGRVEAGNLVDIDNARGRTDS